MTDTANPLAQAKIVAFVATSDTARAKTFYRDTLRLRLVSEDPFALVFDSGGTTLRVTPVPQVNAAQHTVLGWRVQNIRPVVDALARAGVEFQRYPGMQQDDAGIWTSPDGARVAWFKDPDGNTLSVSQW